MYFVIYSARAEGFSRAARKASCEKSRTDGIASKERERAHAMEKPLIERRALGSITWTHRVRVNKFEGGLCVIGVVERKRYCIGVFSGHKVGDAVAFF